MLTNGKVPAARGGSPSCARDAGARGGRYGRAGRGRRKAPAGQRDDHPLLAPQDDGPDWPASHAVPDRGQGGLLDAVRVEGGIQGSLNTLYKPGEILLPVAAREDVVFVVPEGENGDIVTLWTLDYPRIGMGPSPPGQGPFPGFRPFPWCTLGSLVPRAKTSASRSPRGILCFSTPQSTLPPRTSRG